MCLVAFLCCRSGKRKAKNGTKKILILMSDTGGGHRASAQAIKAGFEQTYGKKFQVRGLHPVAPLETP